LFGERGRHDGGPSDIPGQLELAENGIVFFDELHRIPPKTQWKLLGVMEDRVFTRQLTTQPTIPFRGVFIGATNKPPEQCMQDGELQKDLYARFASAYEVVIPPLNDRREDIWAIIIGLSQESRPGTSINNIWTEPTIWALVAIDWKTNVRKLKERVTIILRETAGRRIQVQDISDLLEDEEELKRQCMLLEKQFVKDFKIAEKAVESGKNDWIKSQLDRVQRALSEEEFIELQERLPENCPAKQINDFHEWAAAIVRWCGEKDNQERWGILRSHFSAPGVDGIRKGIPQLHRNEWLNGFEKTLKELNFGSNGNLFDQSRWRKIQNLKMTGAMAWRVFVYQALLGFNHNMKTELDK
jgi:transcriptional regulator with AAA-type ATPase domain